MKLIVSVLHYPVYNRNREIIATSISSTEVHDLARCCMTFGVEMCYIVTPLEKQRKIVERMVDYWTNGFGASYNPMRSKALGLIHVSDSFESMLMEIRSRSEVVKVIGTSARKREEKNITYSELRRMIKSEQGLVTLLFGTGWGLTDEIVGRCDLMLEPIYGAGNYNHLPLRIAIGIILDRIFNFGGENE